jgi:hypothetical protein
MRAILRTNHQTILCTISCPRWIEFFYTLFTNGCNGCMIRHSTHTHASSTIHLLGKCPCGQMSFWANVFLGRCLSGQMSFWANVFWANVFLGKRPSGQTSFWANVLLGKCLLSKCLSGQMSFWLNVFWSNVLWANIHLGKCLSGQMSSGQMSFWANVSGQMSLGKCRVGKCRVTILTTRSLKTFHRTDVVHATVVSTAACQKGGELKKKTRVKRYLYLFRKCVCVANIR